MTRATVHPSFRAYARRAILGAGGAGLGFFAAAAAFGIAHPSAVPVGVGAGAAVFGSTLLVATLYSLRVALTVQDDDVVWKGIVRRGVFRRSDVASRVYGDFSAYGASNPILILLDGCGARLLILHLCFWGPEETAMLLTYLEVPDVELWPKVRKGAVRQQHPNAFKTPIRGLLRATLRMAKRIG